MLYRSTLDPTFRVSFEQAFSDGLAPRGGLYVPDRIVPLPQTFWEQIGEYGYKDLIATVVRQLIGDTIVGAPTEEVIAEAITFDAPLVQVTPEQYALELFHGPTAAFKDFGARFMAACAGRLARQRKSLMTVLVATSGDTGGAVAHSFWRREGTRVVILYPEGMVSPLQEQQFAGLGDNIHAVRVRGTFDDCQRLVKSAFLDRNLSEALGLTSANSINIARLLPQTLYYVRAYQQCVQAGEVRPLCFVVPCGNVGNLTAGLYAQALGLPRSRFVAASNANRTIPDFVATGVYSPRPSLATISNAMDVGAPNNLPRIIDLFDGSISDIQARIEGVAVSDDQTRATIGRVWRDYGYIYDPHGAVAAHAAFACIRDGEAAVVAHTAHPAKFEDIVRPIVGDALTFPSSLTAARELTAHWVSLSSREDELRAFLNTLG
jgi:threonine synthase